MTPTNTYAFRLIALLLTGGSAILAAAGQDGGPFPGAWWIAPTVGLVTLVAAFLRNPDAAE